jgi:hypothetical protein
MSQYGKTWVRLSSAPVVGSSEIEDAVFVEGPWAQAASVGGAGRRR